MPDSAQRCKGSSDGPVERGAGEWAASLDPEIRSVHKVANSTSGALVHELHEPLSLGRGEVDMIGDALLACDADGETVGGDAESRLAFGKRAQGIGSGEFRMVTA